MAKEKTTTEGVILPKEKKSSVKLISYAIKMTIPTGEYANIIPEIVVGADTLEEAEKVVMPYMDKLWREYYMISTRPKPAMKPVPTPSVSISNDPEILPLVNAGTTDTYAEPSVMASVSLVKATNAVNSCMSTEALDVIKSQIEKSVKLGENEKIILTALVSDKYIALNPNHEQGNPS